MNGQQDERKGKGAMVSLNSMRSTSTSIESRFPNYRNTLKKERKVPQAFLDSVVTRF